MIALIGKLIAAKLVFKVAAATLFSSITLALASVSTSTSDSTDSHTIALAAVASSAATVGTLMVLIWNTHNQRSMVKSQAAISDNVNLGNLATNLVADRVEDTHAVATEAVLNTTTLNGLRMGELADKELGEKIQATIAHDDRTSAEQARVDNLTEPGALERYDASLTPADRVAETAEALEVAKARTPSESP